MSVTVRAEMVASVHSVLVEAGQAIEVGDTLMILESMKMEIPVLCESAGIVSEIAVAPGDVIREGMSSRSSSDPTPKPLLGVLGVWSAARR